MKTNPLGGIRLDLRIPLAVLWPLALWGLLWLSLQSGEGRNVLHPPSAIGFLHGIRAVLPIGAAFVATAMILFSLYRGHSLKSLFLGPIGFATAYGLIGVVSASRSPDATTALYWTGAYLSVPLVLLAIARGRYGLERIVGLINITWLVIILGVAAMLTLSFLFLDLHSQILNSSAWLDCGSRKSEWFKLTSGALRGTGVGRYAAIAAIIALAGIWHRNYRFRSGLLLVASFVLLWMSGARTATLAFTVAAALVVLLHGRKWAVVAGVVVVLLAAPVVWASGVHNTLADNCMFRGFRGAPVENVPENSSTLSDGTATGLSGESGPNGESEPSRGAVERIRESFRTLSGRTAIWGQGLDLFKESPLLGHGFHAVRLKLNQHMHNTLLHSLVQTGLIGSALLMLAFLMGWWLFIRALRIHGQLPQIHRLMVVQAGGILTFLSVRAIAESPGAFFGVDWLILAPILMYLQLVNRREVREGTPA